jgi:UDP-N-acetylmuramate dehydrogenase
MEELLREHVSLAPYTTLGIGGEARFFLEARSEASFVDGIRFAHEQGLPLFVLGGGSNLLISDDGFPGLVLRIALEGKSFTPGRTSTEVTAAAGEDWDSLVEDCVGRNLAGFECLSGIPGSVGGTPIQNVGAYGQEISETLIAVRCYDRVQHAVIEIDSAHCRFGYRSSIFNTTHRERYVVLSVLYRLTSDGRPSLRYAELQDHFSSPQNAALGDVRHAVLSIRSHKGMVIDPRDPDSRSAGSFFKNPIIDSAGILRISQRLKDIPSVPLSDGRYKISAAWLIERSGLKRGDAKGNVGISTKHALALVNRGNATARELLSFANDIRSAVHEASGINLQLEPVLVGFEKDEEL